MKEEENAALIEGERTLNRMKIFHERNAPEAIDIDRLEYKPKNSYSVKTYNTIKPKILKIPKELQQFNRLDPSRNTLTTKKNQIIQDSDRNIIIEKKKSPIKDKSNVTQKLTIVQNVSELKNLTPSGRIGAIRPLTLDQLEEEESYDLSSSPLFLIISKEFSNEEKYLIINKCEIETKSKFLPLEYFDDEETFEKYDRNDILSGKYKVFSLFYKGKSIDYENETKNNYEWRECKVLEYNQETNSYLIEWMEERKEMQQFHEFHRIEESDQDGSNDNVKLKKWVKRLNLLVEGDDTFDMRVRTAKMRRKKEEEKMYYYLQIDKVISDEDIDLRPFEKQISDGVLRLVADEFPVRHLPIIESYVDDAKEHYKKTVKEGIFLYFLNSGEEMEKYKKYGWFKEEIKKNSVIAPYLGVVEIPEYDFISVFEVIEKSIFLIHEELISALSSIHYQLEGLRKSLNEDGKGNKLIETEDIPMPCNLEEFISLQNDVLGTTTKKLKDDWCQKVTTIIQNDLDKFFNFFEDDIEVFESSMMKRFLKLTNIILSSQLRDFVYEELENFKDFILPFSPIERDNFDPNEITGFRPLFLVQIVDKVSTGEGKIDFQPPLETILDAVRNIFFNVLEETEYMAGIGEALFPLLSLTVEQFSITNNNIKAESRTRELWRIIEGVIVSNFKEPKYLLELYQKYQSFLALSDNHAQQFFEENKSKLEFSAFLHSVRKELNRLNTAANEVSNVSSDNVNFSLLGVDCTSIKQALSSKTTGSANELMRLLTQWGTEESKKITDKFTAIFEKIQIIPQNAEEMDELRRYLLECSKEIETLQQQFAQVKSSFTLLSEFSFEFPNDVFSIYVDTHTWPRKVYGVLEDSNIRLEEDKRKFMDELYKDISLLTKNLEEYTKELASFSDFNDLENKVEEYYEKVKEMDEKINESKKNAELYNSREKMFNLNTTEFAKLKDLEKTFKPYNDLWSTAYEKAQLFPKWNEGVFMLLNPDQIEESLAKWTTNIRNLDKALSAKDTVAKEITKQLKHEISDFKKHMPLIKALRNEGLRQRHWKKIVNLPVEFGKSNSSLDIELINTMNLGDFVNIGFEERPILEKIIEISDNASKEAVISRNLEKMYGQWRNINFHLDKYFNTYKLVELDELQQLLDEQIVMTQAMRASPYVKELETEVIAWENKLLERSDIMTEWIKCQVGYLYLEPIFTSQDIAAQLPDEATKFGMVDKLWKNVMDNAYKTKVVAQVISDENLKENFETANKRLDQIHAGLKQYLETKRRSFPRFYFLSDDELLEILSETKDPTRVQPHLKKCFEGIDKLEFTEDGRIVAMLSKQGEKIAFTKPVIPSEKNGRVELWLLEVETEMKVALRHVIEQSINAYGQVAGSIEKRSQWILTWPGQVVLTVGQLFWTKEVEEAIKIQGVKGIQRYFTKLTKQQKALIELVRGEDLTLLQSITLGALVVIDVHARDVVANLVKEEVSDIADFEWQSQLRYYWEELPKETPNSNTPKLSTQGSSNNLVDSQCHILVRQITAVINYGYEYLGNNPRLVITPLTDRCYRTLTGALQLYKGGAPEGPAGTGKTETTKDLAKAVAKHCVVYNCSDTLTYESMAQFFRGLASSGAWSCFDEFNRIELEVLSVVAQQIQNIQMAVASRATRFIFEDMEISMNPQCAIFITMNPGYAGRSELPDNLKALFRPVAMMIPDYALIAEISLFSYGFLEGRKLARKIVTTYKLCSEQLSSQDHYDYGMRAVKAVLVRAGTLKRQFPDMDEEQLMLKALTDVNLPKFVSHDITLFEGIISDLFPGVKQQSVDYAELNNAVLATCKEMNLQPVPFFLEKIIQLHEMIIVRHGLMLVGYPMSGKTSSYRVLKSALEKTGEKVKICVLSPKAVTLHQLYGYKDTKTKEWKDGVLAIHFEKLSIMPEAVKKWLICDGPVDAIWIESMNTVLDDNKKLCLTSGQIIKMGENMNMIFEVQDLQAASPATVSRCGMVYMEAEKLGSWEPFLASWFTSKTFPEALKESIDLEAIQQLITTLFSTFMPDLLTMFKFEFSSSSFIKIKSDAMLTKSTIDIMESLMDEFADPKLCNQINIKDKQLMIECIFLYAIVWSIGVITEERTKFDKLFRDLIEEKSKSKVYKFLMPIPEKHSTHVFDYVFDKKAKKWVEWLASEYAPKQSIPPTMEFRNIIVPTSDTIRFQFMLKTLLDHNKQILFVGPTGTGKSLYIKEFLLNIDSMYSEDQKSPITPAFINFSATTTPNLTQDIIESKLTRRKQGYLGPPIGKKAVIFVDDLNLPSLDIYGAQPTIELLRQWQDHGGWYEQNNKQGAFTNIVDVLFLCAMGPPGGGRNEVTARFTRHFNVIGVTSFENQTLTAIFNEITNWFLSSNNLTTISRTVTKQLVLSSINLYNEVISNFRPTPEKSHYTFNLRDLSKVFQGIVSVGVKLEGRELDNFTLLKLWCHESIRVFHDRLVNEQDRETFFKLMEEQLQNNELKNIWELDKEDFDFRNTIFTSLLDDQGEKFKEVKMNTNKDMFSTNPKVEDISKLHAVLNSKLEMYNESQGRMDLVLFNFAIEHIARITRIVTQPGGNALLIGVGGSGRQSLTKLAAYVSEYSSFQIQLTKSFSIPDWKDKMKELLLSAGVKKQQTVFIFTDNQIKYQEFLEDISSLLNTGEIPNLFERDELKDIYENLRAHARQEGKQQTNEALYSYFIDRCKQCLHIVLCMSPVGQGLRTYLRMFPSLVNCCTIDWFSSWPDEALQAVAERFIRNINERDNESEETENDDDEDINYQSFVNICVYFHNTTIELSRKYREKMKRYNYVTPTTYLQLLKNFTELVRAKKKELNTLRGKFELGLRRIAETDKDVNIMQKELEVLQPTLIELSKQNEELSKKIEKESVIANEKAKKLAVEQEELNTRQEKNAEERKLCLEALERVEPIWAEAKKKVSEITSQQIAEVRGMGSPPEGVKMVLKAICILKGEKVKMADDGMGRKTKDYWATSKEMMARAGFLKYIKEFDVESLTKEMVDTLNPILQGFDVEKIKRSSAAATALMDWLFALVKFFTANSEILPKRKALEEAEIRCAEDERILQEKKKELDDIKEMIGQKEKAKQECETKKNELENEYEEVSTKLERAKKLIKLLEGEKVRWEETLSNIIEQLSSIYGDVLLSSGVISYLGTFTGEYRKQIIKKWKTKLSQNEIKFSEEYSLASTLAEPMEIRNWQIKEGLPSDDFSIENATIVKNTITKWPLFIDPQGQALNWIKEREKNQKKESDSLLIIQMSNSSLIKSLEKAITQGTTTVIEGIAEEIEAALDPLLTMQTYTISGVKYISLSETATIYNDNFKLYLITSYSNPHFLPEVAAKVQIINFMITPNGLEEQLLAIVVKIEEKKLESEKNNLMIQNAKYQEQLKHYQDKILQLLVETSKEKMLDDDTVINTLSSSKQTSKKIEQKQIESKKTEKDIDQKRNLYRPVAENASTLFFAISELPNIDPMYQYSLTWYKDLFTQCITELPQEENRTTQQKIEQLIDYFQHQMYTKVCRSLFQKDKLLFSLLLCIQLMKKKNSIDIVELKFLLTGQSPVIKQKDETPRKLPEWVSENMYNEITELNGMSKVWNNFENEFFNKYLNDWKRVYDSSKPHEETFPGEWEKLNKFQKMMILRILRPDKLTPAIQSFVKQNMDARYIEAVQFNLRTSYMDSSPTKPLIFILSPGVDPMEQLRKFAEQEQVNLRSLSLGQGQEEKAADLINQGSFQGNWIVLQNCHLLLSWMPKLEKIVDDFARNEGKIATTYRLWLTSMPSKRFPVSILQRGVKITNEPPKGLKANLLQSWQSDPISDSKFFSGCKKSREFKKLLFGLTFFHALVQERRKFGSLGWNISYEFNDSDLNISLRQLHMFLNNKDSSIPFKALVYLAGECNYGGRVTDDHDRRTLIALLSDYYCEDILEDGYKFSPSGLYHAPSGDKKYNEYIQFLEKLPVYESPEVFGLHENATITKDQAEIKNMFDSLITTQENSTEEDEDDDKAVVAINEHAVIYEISSEILSKLPENFPIEGEGGANVKFKVDYHESMNTVFVQELIRFNRLLDCIRNNLTQLQLAIKGLVVMDRDLEQVSQSLENGKVPELWAKVSYPSRKPLRAYVQDLLKRIEFLRYWFDHGKPKVYWISGFYFTQSFLTGIKQNFARKHKISIDQIDFEFEVTDMYFEESMLGNLKEPEIGCYVYGLFLEGAAWDRKARVLTDPKPKQLFDEMPIIWFKPVNISANDNQNDEMGYSYYTSPVYKTSERRGTLSTTGHSTNFVMHVKLPISDDKDEKYWIKRGNEIFVAGYNENEMLGIKNEPKSYCISTFTKLEFNLNTKYFKPLLLHKTIYLLTTDYKINENVKMEETLNQLKYNLLNKLTKCQLHDMDITF
ncbi:hypothetical protein ABK040_008689 [Willaertia magna]